MISGKPYEMGEQAGRKCSKLAREYRDSMAEAITYSTGMSWERAVSRAKLYLPHAESFYPEFVDELRGYGSGSKIGFEAAFTLCCHELLAPSGFKGCTDVAVSSDVTKDGNVLIGHNEDWSSEQQDTVVLIHARPRGMPEFITTSYAGLVPSSGMNSAGISLTGNALSPNDERIGIPKLFPVRKVLATRSIGAALEAAMPSGRASSYNNICSDKNGEIYSLEGSATDFECLYSVNGHMVHTNHYVSDRMRRYEAEPEGMGCSTFRYNRAKRLLEAQLGDVTVESIASIFRDHVNKPGSICRHRTPGVHRLDVSETIFSVIYDLTRLEAHVCGDKPCKGSYEILPIGR